MSSKNTKKSKPEKKTGITTKKKLLKKSPKTEEKKGSTEMCSICFEPSTTPLKCGH